jgi:hypothetical protein
MTDKQRKTQAKPWIAKAIAKNKIIDFSKKTPGRPDVSGDAYSTAQLLLT